MKRSTLYILILILACAGLVNTILIHEKTSGVIAAPCVIVHGCDTVLYSSYANIFGVPVSTWGTIYYTIMIVLGGGYLVVKKIALSRLVFAGAIVGFVCSLYFLYLQIVVIRALCSFCLLSLIDTIVLVTLASLALRRHDA